VAGYTRLTQKVASYTKFR